MRGFPLLRALLAFFVIASAGWPLWKLTTSATASTPSQAAVSALAEVHLQLTFSTPPRSFALSHLGRELWAETAPAAAIERTLQMPFPKEGVDLQWRVNWPPEIEQAALRVRVITPEGAELERTVWGHGEMEETLTFP